MAMDEQPFLFPQQEILDFLKANLDMNNLTLQELKNPTPVVVQNVYVRILREVGFDTDAMLMPSMELQNSLDHFDIVKEMIPTLSLQAGCSYLVTKLVGDTSFGIMDLLRPTAKRTQRFVSVLQNFWLFCNQRVAETDAVQASVVELVNQKQRFEDEIENFKAEINRCKCKAVEDKAAEESLHEEIEELKKQLEGFTPRREELDREKVYLDEELARLGASSDEMEARRKKLQTEIGTLQGVFEGAATLEKLDRELAQLAEVLEAKELRKLEFRNNLEALERTREEYTAVLELVKQIAKEEQKVREIVARIREQHGHLDTVKMELDELESDLRETQQRVATKATELNKAKLQWGRRKKGKEEELEEGRRVRQESRQLLGEEQLAAMDLANQVRDLSVREEEERVMMGQEAAVIRGHYATLLESLQKFNEKMSSEFQVLEAAREKMATPSAL